MKEETPICPKCGSRSNMILHGDVWVCHATHPIDKFTEWWNEYGKEAAYPMDLFRAERLARSAWHASRIEISKYCLPVFPPEEEKK